MKRTYCCCALPLLNFGIYTCLAEQLVLGALVGTLAVATPSIVGAASPSFAPWILAIICYAGAAIQILGFIGVKQEKTVMFRRYTTLHIMLTLAAFSVAAVWIAISATRHSTAQSACESKFFPAGSGSSETSSEGQTLCNVFAWADIGIMAGLWAILAVAQAYFYFMVSSYGRMQRADHAQYKSLGTSVDNAAIPLSDRNDPWDARMSMDVAPVGPRSGVYDHARQESDASVATVLAQQEQAPKEYGYGGGQPAPYQYPPSRQDSSGSTRQRYNGGYPTRPSNAYTEDAGPTPFASNPYYSGDGGEGGIYRPEPFQAHPAEGSMGRKTPRIGEPY